MLLEAYLTEKLIMANNENDDSYVSRPGNKSESIPVQSDRDVVEDNNSGVDVDSDAQLGKRPFHVVLVSFLLHISTAPHWSHHHVQMPAQSLDATNITHPRAPV